jgi:hypothetical protein
MAISDPHDPRYFRRYLQFNADGTVASVHEFEAGAICPLPAAIEVTDLGTIALDEITIAPADVATLQSAVNAHADKSAAVEKAIADLADAATALTLVKAQTQGTVSVAAAKIVAPIVAPAPVVANG